MNQGSEQELLIEPGPGIGMVGAFQNPGTTIWNNSAVAWKPFTPTLLNFTLGTNPPPSLSNNSRYLVDGKTVDMIIALKFGSGATWSATDWGIGIPADAGPILDTSGLFNNHGHFGTWSVLDISTGDYHEGNTFFVTGFAQPIRMRVADDIGGIPNTANMRQGVPITFAVGDELYITTRYEKS